MPLKYRVKSLDEVPEALRDQYVAQSDGHFHLEVEGVVDKARVDEFRTNNVNLKRDLDKLASALGGRSTEDVTRLLAAAEERERTESERRGEYDKLLVTLKTQHATELSAARAETERRTRSAHEAERRRAAMEAIADEKGNSTLLLNNVLARLGVSETVEGDLVRYDVHVVDAAGKPIIKDGQGATLSPRDYVKSLKELPEYQPAFPGTGASGSGANGSSKSSTTGGAGQIDWASIPPTERMTRARAEGITK